jgi:D-serine deaminase-like pyridoxal phosphate-dependent protein
MLDDLRLHRPLLGRPGSRRELNTPVLVIDRDALDRNIRKMADFARSKGIPLRPHAKTHKSVDIARRQMNAGAVGICCAKLGEAEALAAGGIGSILLTSPVVTGPAIARLIALNARMDDLMVVIDNPSNVTTLAAAPTKKPLKVLIDIDPGLRRTGVTSPAAAIELLKRMRTTSNLVYQGVQMYCSSQQHIASYADRAAAIEERTQYLRSVMAALADHDAHPSIVTGSGTGTHRIDAALGVFTEWQVGSYVFMDRQYAECESGAGNAPLFEYSLFVDTRVISANTLGMATIDAGFKALATDGGPPAIVAGAPPGAQYHFMGDEHGAIIDPDKTHKWNIGDSVRLAVPHCDPTVNLYDAYHVISDDTLREIWPVNARGRSR